MRDPTLMPLRVDYQQPTPGRLVLKQCVLVLKSSVFQPWAKVYTYSPHALRAGHLVKNSNQTSAFLSITTNYYRSCSTPISHILADDAKKIASCCPVL